MFLIATFLVGLCSCSIKENRKNCLNQLIITYNSLDSWRKICNDIYTDNEKNLCSTKNELLEINKLYLGLLSNKGWLLDSLVIQNDGVCFKKFDLNMGKYKLYVSNSPLLYLDSIGIKYSKNDKLFIDVKDIIVGDSDVSYNIDLKKWYVNVDLNVISNRIFYNSVSLKYSSNSSLIDNTFIVSDSGFLKPFLGYWRLFNIRVPRHYLSNLVIDLYDSEKHVSVPLGRYLEANSFDFNAKNLRNINLELDMSIYEMSISFYKYERVKVESFEI